MKNEKQNKTKQTKQNKTKQNKKPNKTKQKQSKTKQNKKKTKQSNHEEAFAKPLKKPTEPVLLYKQYKRKNLEGPVQALPAPPQKRKPDAPWRLTASTSVSVELFDAYYAMVVKRDDFEAPLFDQLKSFVHFTAMTHAQQAEKQMSFFETPLGEVGADDMQVLLWLAWQRYHGKHPDSVPKPLSAATLRNHLGSLRRALFECNLQELPPWAKWKDKHGASVLNQLFEWKLQDARSGVESAGKEKTWLLCAEVELYCLGVLEKLWHGGGATDWELCTALLLRVQAGSNQRSGNLVKDLKWRDVKYSPPNWPVMDLVFTKMGACQSSKALAMKNKVERHLDDRLTFNLFKAWFEKHNAYVQPHHHFFPQFLQKSQIKWESDLGSGHLEAVRHCALTLGRATTPEEAKAFTTTSVRRGFAVETEEGVQRYKQQRNYQGGWARQSNLQEKVYCPENAKYMAGPLYWDKEATDAHFEHFFAMHNFEKFSALLCAYCGLPNCECVGCNAGGKAGHKMQAHSCWRAGKTGQQPKYDPVKQRPHEEEQLLQQRQEAWEAVGSPTTPLWDGLLKAYCFPAPEEQEQYKTIVF